MTIYQTDPAEFVSVGRKQIYADIMEAAEELRPGQTYFAENLRRPRGVSLAVLRKRISSALSLHVRADSRYQYRVRITVEGMIAIECVR